MTTPNNVSVVTTEMPTAASTGNQSVVEDPNAEAQPVENGAPEDAAAVAKAAKAKSEADAAALPDTLELPETAEEARKVEAKTTGIEVFDTVATLLADKGVTSVNTIMEEFMDTGELTLQHKASIIEALGDSVAALAFKQMETAAEGLVASAKEASSKTLDYAKEKFGGEGGDALWQEIKAYVTTSEAGFSEADLASMNDMLDAGGLQAQLVIDRIHAVYNADPNVSTPGNLLEGDSAANGITFEPLSRSDYTVQMGKAVRDFGEDSFQVRELDRRRTMTMRRE